MQVIIRVSHRGGFVTASYNDKQKPDTVLTYEYDIEIDEDKLLQALELAKEACMSTQKGA